MSLRAKGEAISYDYIDYFVTPFLVMINGIQQNANRIILLDYKLHIAHVRENKVVRDFCEPFC
jgi:hypothetical protein